MKKKLVALMLMASMVIGVVGCGNDQPANTGESQTNANESVVASEGTADTEENEEPVHITFWTQNSFVNGDQKGEADVIAAMNEYSLEKINVTFDWRTDSKANHQLELASSDTIDLLWWNGPSLLSTYVAQGALYDITELIKERDVLWNEYMTETEWESVMYYDKLYAVPSSNKYFTGYGFKTSASMADRVEAATGIVFEDIAIDSCRDIDNLTPYLEAVAAIDDSLVTRDIPSYNNWMKVDPVYETLCNYAVGLDRNTGKIIDLYDTQEYYDWLKVIYEWNQAGYIHEGKATGNLSSSDTKPWMYAGYEQTGNFGVTTQRLEPLILEQINASTGIENKILEIGDRYLTSDSLLQYTWGISSKCDEETARACLKFIELLATDPYFADLYTFGIEGVHFNYTADGRVEKIADSGWDNPVTGCSSQMTTSPLSTESVDKHERLGDDVATAITATALGFRYDSSATSAELAALSAVTEEFEVLMEYGFYNPDDYLEKMLETRKKAGVDKVIEDMQAQYDAWLAKQ